MGFVHPRPRDNRTSHPPTENPRPSSHHPPRARCGVCATHPQPKEVDGAAAIAASQPAPRTARVHSVKPAPAPSCVCPTSVTVQRCWTEKASCGLCTEYSLHSERRAWRCWLKAGVCSAKWTPQLRAAAAAARGSSTMALCTPRTRVARLARALSVGSDGWRMRHTAERMTERCIRWSTPEVLLDCHGLEDGGSSSLLARLGAMSVHMEATRSALDRHVGAFAGAVCTSEAALVLVCVLVSMGLLLRWCSTLACSYHKCV
jgi:hypothetical protein